MGTGDSPPDSSLLGSAVSRDSLRVPPPSAGCLNGLAVLTAEWSLRLLRCICGRGLYEGRGLREGAGSSLLSHHPGSLVFNSTPLPTDTRAEDPSPSFPDPGVQTQRMPFSLDLRVVGEFIDLRHASIFLICEMGFVLDVKQEGEHIMSP